MLAAAAICVIGGAGVLYAKGGTAKPPGGTGVCAATVPACVSPVLPPAGPVLLAPAPAINSSSFSITGFVQSVTVSGGCVVAAPGAAANISGGTLTVNGIVITVPSNTIVQFPANTLTWHDAVCPTQAGVTPAGLDYALGLDGALGSATAAAGPQPGPILGTVEVRVDGNIVAPGNAVPRGAAGELYIAGLVYFNQQSLNSGGGIITFIDYAGDGSIYVKAGGATETRLLINDPNGRFGRAQTSTDARFQVDDENPTIKAAATGYPMCVPRTNPAVADDPLCPSRNRPISNGAVASCRNFAAAGVAPTGGELPATAAGLPCTAFVMKAVAGMPGTAAFGPNPGANVRAANEPDPREQAPFMVGDFINWAGTLVRGGGTAAAPARPTTNGDVIWVHTIDANVGIYTQPKTLPAYISIGEFVVGVDPQPTGVAVLPGVEATARISLEASVSDVGSIVDIYWDDKGFSLPAGSTTGPLVATPGSEYFRWLTMEAMTGTLTDLNAGRNVYLTSPQPFGGGIATQFIGPQPGRARIRAIKIPNIVENAALACPTTAGSQNCAITNSPTRNIRVVIRSLCAPAATGATAANAAVVPSTNLDNGRWYSINGAINAAPTLPGVIAGSDGTCLQRAQFANGLFSGQYMAPVGEFIYPEPTLGGGAIIPSNFWQLGFMVYGEGGDGSTARQNPQPW